MPDLYSDDFAVQNGGDISVETFYSGFSQMTIESEKKVVISSPLQKEVIAITRLQ